MPWRDSLNPDRVRLAKLLEQLKVNVTSDPTAWGATLHAAAHLDMCFRPGLGKCQKVYVPRREIRQIDSVVLLSTLRGSVVKAVLHKSICNLIHRPMHQDAWSQRLRPSTYWGW